MRRAGFIALSVTLLIVLGVRVQFAGFASFGAITGGTGGIGANQPGSDGQLNVLNYISNGACVADGVTDCLPAFNQATAVACASSSTTTGSTIYIPTSPGNHYFLSKPWIIGCNNIRIVGGGRSATELVVPGPGEWALNIIPTAVPAFPTTTALISGSAASMLFTHANADSFIELRDMPAGEINNLTAITIEGFVNLTTNSFSSVIAASGGQHLSTDPSVGALSFGFTGGGNLTCTFNTGGSATTVTEGTALPTSTLRWVACSYDGTTVRLYDAVPGAPSTAPVASSAASGNIVQAAWESFTVGKLMSKAIESGLTTNGPNGAVDGFRLSNTARYTGTITAPAASLPTCDSNCLAEWTGVTSGQLVQMNSKGVLTYLTPRDTTQYNVANVEVDDLDIEAASGANSNGLFLRGCTNCTFHNIGAGAVSRSTRNGIYWYNNSFQDRVSNGVFVASGWFGMAVVGASGVMESSHVQMVGGEIGVVMAGSGGLMSNMEVTQNSIMQFGTILTSAGGEEQFGCVDCDYDMENPGALVATFTDWALYGAYFIHSGVDANTGVIPIVLDSIPANGFAIRDSASNLLANNTAISFKAAPSGPIVVDNYKITGSGSVLVSAASAKYVNTPGCGGNATLSGGSGTVSATCITAASICRGIDVTLGTNIDSLLGAPTAGSVGISGGTGTDVVKVVCQ